MTIPLQFASFYDCQEVFVWCNCLLDLGMDFLIILSVVLKNDLGPVLASGEAKNLIFGVIPASSAKERCLH